MKNTRNTLQYMYNVQFLEQTMPASVFHIMEWHTTRDSSYMAYVGADSLILKFEFWINRGNNVIQMTLYVPISVIGCGRRSQIYWCIVLNLLKLCTSLSYLSSPIRTTEYITCIYRVYPLISWFRKVKSIFMNSSKSVHCKLVHSCGQFLIY